MKVRHIDLHPDEFLAAVAGEMSPAELGVYWMVCLLHYSRGETIDADSAWLRGKFRTGKGNNVVAEVLARLIESGRVFQDGSKIGVRRCQEEIDIALRRIEEASKRGKTGGRPPKENNGLEKGSAFIDEKLTTNHQPSTIKEEKPSLSGGKKPLKQKQGVPEDWLPDDGDRAFAEERAGWVGQRLDDEVGAFRDYHRKVGNLFADVSAAWRTWVRNGAKFQAERGNTRRGAAPPAVEALPLAYDEDEQWRARLRSWIDPARGGPTRRRWIDSVWGPPPGQPGCKVPRKLLQELEFSEWEAA